MKGDDGEGPDFGWPVGVHSAMVRKWVTHFNLNII